MFAHKSGRGRRGGVAHWLRQLIEHCTAETPSAVINLGGGDCFLSRKNSDDGIV
jgi:hypothetical protein